MGDFFGFLLPYYLLLLTFLNVLFIPLFLLLVKPGVWEALTIYGEKTLGATRQRGIGDLDQGARYTHLPPRLLHLNEIYKHTECRPMAPDSAVGCD